MSLYLQHFESVGTADDYQRLYSSDKRERQFLPKLSQLKSKEESEKELLEQDYNWLTSSMAPAVIS